MMIMLPPAQCLHLSTVSLHDMQSPSGVLSGCDFVSEGGMMCLLLFYCAVRRLLGKGYQSLNMLMEIANEKSVYNINQQSNHPMILNLIKAHSFFVII